MAFSGSYRNENGVNGHHQIDKKFKAIRKINYKFKLTSN